MRTNIVLSLITASFLLFNLSANAEDAISLEDQINSDLQSTQPKQMNTTTKSNPTPQEELAIKKMPEVNTQSGESVQMENTAIPVTEGQLPTAEPLATKELLSMPPVVNGSATKEPLMQPILVEEQPVLTEEQSIDSIEQTKDGFQFEEIEEITFRDIEPIILADKEIQNAFNTTIQKIIDASNYADRRLVKEINDFRALLEKEHKFVISQQSTIKDKMLNIDQTNELYDKNLALARWVIVVVSMGSILLMLIIYLIWRGVVNVNKNEMEVVFAHQDMKKKFTELLDQVQLLNDQVNDLDKKKVNKENITEETPKTQNTSDSGNVQKEEFQEEIGEKRSEQKMFAEEEHKEDVEM